MSENCFQVRRKHIQCVIPVWPLQEERSLSLAAKGLLALLLSFPDGWEVRMTDIIARSNTGRTATRRAMAELQAAGYIRRQYVRDGNRIRGSRYVVSDVPFV